MEFLILLDTTLTPISLDLLLVQITLLFTLSLSLVNIP
jgi:hypothetical protein